MLPIGRILAATLLIPVCMPALAASGPIYQRADDKLRYEHCLSLAGQNPVAALSIATDWSKGRGGPPAEHCAAVALVGLKRYGEAAARLDALGRGAGMGRLRPALFDQAGNAWMLAGDTQKAVASFQAALVLSADDADLYADLARAQAMQAQWPAVENDLNAALNLSPRRADLLVLRASARQAMGKFKDAGADADTALALRPGYVEALVQRGAIRRDAGDLKGARADFQAALARNAAGDAADEARRNLAALDAAAARPAAKPLQKPVAKPVPKKK